MMFNQTTFDLLAWVAQNAVNIFLQSTVLILVGLIAAKILLHQGSAVQSAIYRATLIAVLFCPIAAILIAQLGWTSWTIKLPSTIQVVSIEVPSNTPAVNGNLGVSTDREPASALFDEVEKQPDNAGSVDSEVAVETPVPDGLVFRSNVPSESKSANGFVSEFPESALSLTTEFVEQEVTNTLWVGIYWTILAIWISGSLLLLVRLVWAYQKINRLRNQSPLATNSELEICHRFASELQVTAPGVYRNSLISSPCLTGIASPAILLPTEIEDLVALEKAFAHELAHLRRRDTLWNLIQRVALALFFFQPLLWRLVYRLETTAEEVCDDFVVRHCLDRTGYAQQLVELAESNLLVPNIAGLGMFSSKTMLGHRVIRILDTTRKLTTQVSWPMIGTIGSLALSAAVLCSLIGDRVPTNVMLDELQDSAEVSKAESSMLRFIGHVVDESGKPISGAAVQAFPSRPYGFPKVAGGSHAETTSGIDGTFQIEFEQSKVVPESRYEFDENITLVVTKQGYQINWADRRTWLPKFSTIPILKDESNGTYLPVEIPLKKDTQPLKITLVDTEGAPIENARVKIQSINKLKSGGADKMIKAAAEGITFRGAVVKHLDDSVYHHGLPDYASDENGEIKIEGVGDNRIAKLVITGKGICSTPISVLMCETKPFSFGYGGQMSHSIKYLGRNATVTCEPSQLIRGQVVDSETGEPLAGAHVQSSQFAGSFGADPYSAYSLIKVTTDQEGYFELDGMPKGPGNKIAVIPSDEHPYFMMRYVVPEKEGYEPIDMTLKVRKGTWIRGKAVDSDTGEPIVGAWMHYLPFLSNEFAQKSGVYGDNQYKEIQGRYLTQDDGTFQLVGLPGKAVVGIEEYDGKYPTGIGWETFTKDEIRNNGKWAKTFSRPVLPGQKWPTAMKKVDIAEDAIEHRVDFEISTGLSTSLTIVDPDGQPLTGAVADRLRSDNEHGKVLKESTVKAGGFKPNEKRTIRFTHREKKLGCIVELDSSTFAEQKNPIEIRLQPYAKVRGKLVDDNGDPVANAMLNFDVGGGDFSIRLREVSSNREGIFEHDEVLVGAKYYIIGEHPNNVFSAGKNLDVSTSELIDVGTINVNSEFEDPLPEPKRSPLEGASKKSSITDSAQPKQNDQVKFSGVVVDLHDKPVAGVEIVRNKNILAASQSDGTFEFELPKKVANRSESGVTFGLNKTGYAMSLVQIKNGERESARLTIVNDIYPITGKLVDTEGNPIEGAIVLVERVLLFDGYDLTALVEKARNSAEPVKLPSPGIITSLKKTATTARDGSFKIEGIGDNRVAELRISGEKCAIQGANVITTRFAQVENLYSSYGMLSSQPLKVYGHSPTIVAEPSAPIAGVVIDSETQQPIAGLTVSSYSFADNDSFSKLVDNRILNTTTDSDGRFQLDGMLIGVGNEIVISTDPKADIRVPYLAQVFEVPPSQGVDPIEMKLTAIKGNWINGQVINHETQKPMSKVSVKYAVAPDNEFFNDLTFSQKPTFHQHLNTDKDGRFKLVGMPGLGFVTALVHYGNGYPAGQGWEAVSKEHRNGLRHPFSPQRTTAIKPIEIGGGDAEIQIEISKGGFVRMTTVDRDNNPVDGVTLTYLPDYVHNSKRMETAEFDAPEFMPGKKRKIVFRNSKKGLGTFRQIGLEDSPAKVVLQPMATLRARCLNEDSNGTGEVAIRLGMLENGYIVYRIRDIPKPDKNGNFEIKLVPGKYAFWFNSIAGFSGYKKVELKPGEDFNLGEIDVSKKIFEHGMSSPTENPLNQVPFEPSKSN